MTLFKKRNWRPNSIRMSPIVTSLKRPRMPSLGRRSFIGRFAPPIFRTPIAHPDLPNPRAVSHAGAKGLMQLMDGTAKRFGVANSFDPRQNIEGGTKYLRFLLTHFKGNVELALAGYNAGEHNVAKHGNKIPPFRETQNYVPAVLGYTQSMIDILTASAPLPRYAKLA